MTRAPEAVELTLPVAAEPDVMLRMLGDRLDIVADPVRVERRVLLDTFDGRLRAKGIGADVTTASRGGTAVFALREPGACAVVCPVAVAVAGAAGRPVSVEDVPAALVQERLSSLVGGRVLLAQVEIRCRVRALRVLNGEQKTVVRLMLEEPALIVRGGANVPLANRMHVVPVRGYAAPYAGARGLLETEFGACTGQSLYDEAIAASGRDPAANTPKIGRELSPGMRADHATIAIAIGLLEVAESNVPGVVADLDREFLHDLRIAVRRSRSLLRQMKGVLPETDRERVRAGLRWLQEVTGPVRDLDVQLLDWPDIVAGLSSAQLADLSPLHQLLVERRAAAHHKLVRSLQTKRARDTLARWRALVTPDLGADASDLPDASREVPDVAGRRIALLYRAMVRSGGRIDATSPPEALHDLRKQGKELRYMIEFFGSMWPPETVAPMVRALKDLQDVLGRHNDRHVQADHLRSLGPEVARREGGADALIALGLVVHRLRADAVDARGEFEARFARFAAKGTSKLVKATFGRRDQ